MKNQRKNFFPLIYLLGLVLVLSWAMGNFGQKSNAIAYSNLVKLFQREQVSQFLVKGNEITLLLRQPYDGKTALRSGLADPEIFREQMQSLLDRKSVV